MELTSHDYRSAAKVLEHDFKDQILDDGFSEIHIPTALENLNSHAEALEKSEWYAVDLGKMSVTKDAFARGVDIIVKLTDDGWTAPEGLF